jgi:hypothetical protein
MRDAIVDACRKITEAHETIRRLERFISSAQDVCEHDWEDAPDLFHPHKGEDHQRCKICGKTV